MTKTKEGVENPLAICKDVLAIVEGTSFEGKGAARVMQCLCWLAEIKSNLEADMLTFAAEKAEADHD